MLPATAHIHSPTPRSHTIARVLQTYVARCREMDPARRQLPSSADTGAAAAASAADAHARADAEGVHVGSFVSSLPPELRSGPKPPAAPVATDEQPDSESRCAWTPLAMRCLSASRHGRTRAESNDYHGRPHSHKTTHTHTQVLPHPAWSTQRRRLDSPLQCGRAWPMWGHCDMRQIRSDRVEPHCHHHCSCRCCLFG